MHPLLPGILHYPLGSPSGHGRTESNPRRVPNRLTRYAVGKSDGLLAATAALSIYSVSSFFVQTNFRRALFRWLYGTTFSFCNRPTTIPGSTPTAAANDLTAW